MPYVYVWRRRLVKGERYALRTSEFAIHHFHLGYNKRPAGQTVSHYPVRPCTRPQRVEVYGMHGEMKRPSHNNT